jgi:sugar phosphate isomerase/epimerase
MFAGLALHTWTLDTTTLPQALDAARGTGWEAIELRRLDFQRAVEQGGAAESVLDRVRASGLAVACVGVERGWMFARGPERRRLLAAFAESCRWARALGCGTVMSPVDHARGDLAAAAASLREVGDLAGQHGVRLALEWNCLAEQFNRLEPTRELLARAGHPHCGLLFDTYHFQRSGGRVQDVEGLPAEELVYVQYSDVPRSGGAPDGTLDRLPPGEGQVPFAALFDRLAARYTGFLSYEAPNPAAWALPPAQVAEAALQATRRVLPNS